MRQLFVEDDVNMAQDTDTSMDEAADDIRQSVEGRYVCPFCGAVREQAEGMCPRCTMESTASTRQATKSRIGPWYVLQTRNPAAPGMMFDTLLAFVRKGRVTPRSIVRGPTTHQLWRFAAHVKGLSREFGICFSCGETISRKATLCAHCNRQQDPPTNPDVFLENQDTENFPGPIPIFRDVPQPPRSANDDIVVPDIDEKNPQDAAHDAANEKSRPAPAEQVVAKKSTDGFLTAADLAAAFKLDFQPKGQKRKKATVAPIAMEAEPRLPVRRHRRPRRWGRYVLLLLLMASIGAGAFTYHRDPVFRSQVNGWYATGLTKAKQKWAELNKPSSKPQHASPVPNTVIDVGPSSNVSQATTPATAPAQASKPSPWDELYNTSHIPTPTPVPTPTPTPTGPEIVVSPNPAKMEGPIVKPHTDGGIDDVRTLYRSAIDAEAGGDYATAVKKYEAIKDFPADLWPRDLELRLKVAEQEAKP
jgi:hypothetical protein